MNKKAVEQLAKVQRIFEKAFGKREDTKVYVSEYKRDNVIVVENDLRKAYYNFSGELLDLTNIQAGENE